MMPPEERKRLPELNVSIMTALARLFLAEAEMIAIEKGIMEKNPKLVPKTQASVYKDIVNRLDEAINYFADGLKNSSEGVNKEFKKYYTSFCEAMKLVYEVYFLRLFKT